MDFTDKQVFTVKLNANQTYQLVQMFGRCSVSVKYVGGSSSQGENTTPTTTPTQPATEPSQSTKPTDPPETVPTSSSQPATEPSHTTTPTDPLVTVPSQPLEGENNQGNTQISGEKIDLHDIADAIEGAKDNMLSFSVSDETDGSAFQIAPDALQMAADQGCSISLNFHSDINIHLDNDTLKALGETATNESIHISVTNQSYFDLNAEQQQALEGKSLIMLLDITLSVDGDSLHQLGGTAQITFPNKDANKHWQILYLAEDGTVEVMEITGDEKITFSSNHFSHYALILGEDVSTENNSILPWIVIAAVIVLLGGIAALLMVLKNKRK